MKTVKNILSIFILLTILIPVTVSSQDTGTRKQAKAKYVFLFIGDGMGLAQVVTTQAYLASLENRIGLQPLSFTAFPGIGLASTYAYNQMITCSAAAGTALATGHKTNIGRISMDPEGTKPMKTIAEKAKEQGMKVGIITSTSIDHATPAVFYAHQPERSMYFEIGMNLLNSNFDFFAGGGFLKPDGEVDGEKINIINEAKDHGYTYISTLTGFKNLKSPSGKVIVVSPAPAGEQSLPFTIDMTPNDLSLADFTGKAIELLDNDNGFFMMVESGKVDWACHENDAATAIQEVLALDKAVGKALEFYAAHPDETLIIVTADHETGGLAMGNNEIEDSANLSVLKYQHVSYDAFNKTVKKFRMEKSADPDADFDRMMMAVRDDFGLDHKLKAGMLTATEKSELKKAFLASMNPKENRDAIYGSSEPLTVTLTHILDTRAGLAWTSYSHTAISVPVYAKGTGFQMFSGYMDNTDIPRFIEDVMLKGK
jgi:alkaline phosphatase